MIRTLVFAILAGTLHLRADETSDRLGKAGVAEFQSAHQSWDAKRFATAEDHFRRAAARSPESAAFHYWLGVAAFHRMLQYRSQSPSAANEKAADAAKETAAAAFEKALERDAGHAESHAVLGTILGMKINGGMLRAIRYGPSLQKHQKKALAAGHDNPRVRYLLGTGLLHMAKNRAERQAALDTLLHAEKLFTAEAKKPPGPLEPRWGRSSCLTFIGKANEQLGDQAGAARYFRLALAAHPADHVAREGLARVTAGN
jgi:tetratricopeptide (TPR) repeat protein